MRLYLLLAIYNKSEYLRKLEEIGRDAPGLAEKSFGYFTAAFDKTS